MVLGIYYLTQERPGAMGEGKCFKNVNEAILAYENEAITLHSRIKVRVKKIMPDGSVKRGNIESTLYQRMQLNRLTFYQNRLERLNTKPVKRRGAVQHNRMLLNHILQHIPYLRLYSL